MDVILPAKTTTAKTLKYISIVGVLSLIAAEIGLRLCVGLGSPPLLYKDPDFGYAFKPNQHLKRAGHRIDYNAEGLRAPALKEPKPQNSLRILCVGDSVTNGGQPTDQEDTYPYVLRADLQKHNISSETLNASAGGWATENELAFVRKKGTFLANVIVWQLNTEDLWQPKTGGAMVGSDLFPDKNMPALVEFTTRIAWPNVINIFHGVTKPATSPEYSQPHPVQVNAEDEARALETIGEMIRLSRTSGAEPIILFTCLREELTNPLRYKTQRASLFALAERNGVPIIDVMPGWYSSLKSGRDPFRDQIHPNNIGSALMAHDVARHIENTHSARR